MRYSDQGYTAAQVVGITDAYILDNGFMIDREKHQNKVAAFLAEFGDSIKDGVIEPFLPFWIRKYAPALPDRPKPALSAKTKKQIAAMRQRIDDLNYKPLGICIESEVAQLHADIRRLQEGNTQ